jgi:acyl carrier protein
MNDQEMLAWLIERVAHYTDQPIDRIPPDDRITTIGLDSIGMVGLSGDIEEYLSKRVNPEWMYDHDTLRELAVFLTRLK